MRSSPSSRDKVRRMRRTASLVVSRVIGAWLATSFAGNFGAGWLGSFWSCMDQAFFFALMSAIAVIASVAILALRKSLEAVLQTGGAHTR